MNFALIGAAGYIAPRHMKAIKDTGHNLVAAFDPNDSVGIMDSYFPDARFFTRFEEFNEFLYGRTSAEAIDFVSICSPNHLHFSHIKSALRAGANVICEKPLVLQPEHIDVLADIEKSSGRRVWTILQLRLHPAIVALRDKVATLQAGAKVDVELTYVTSRGSWYLQSWKAEESKSGGIATNIGVHFFDMLHFVYGELQSSTLHISEPTRASGYLEFEKARVNWFLSIDISDVPAAERAIGKRTYRMLKSAGEQIEFSDGFTDLHSKIYQQALQGHGFGLEENRAAISTVASFRKVAPYKLLNGVDSRAPHGLVRSP